MARPDASMNSTERKIEKLVDESSDLTIILKNPISEHFEGLVDVRSSGNLAYKKGCSYYKSHGHGRSW